MSTTVPSRPCRDEKTGGPPPYSQEWLTALPDQQLRELHHSVETELFREYTLDALSYGPDDEVGSLHPEDRPYPLHVHDGGPNRWLEELERRYGVLDEELQRRSPDSASNQPATAPEPKQGPAWLADPAAIRDWLTSPAPGSMGQTVAGSLKIGNDFGYRGELRPDQLADLVQAAQAAGVLRVPEHRVDLLPAPRSPGCYLVTIDRPDGGRLASGPYDPAALADELPVVATRPRGIDAAVRVLTTVTGYVNGTVSSFANRSAQGLRAHPVHGLLPQIPRTAPRVAAASFPTPPSATSQPSATPAYRAASPHQRTSTTANRRSR